jgi:protein phosphatase
LANESDEFKVQVITFIDKLVSHYLLDDGRLVVAHAGMKENLAGRGSGGVREFALYGETTGETDEFGLPVRYNWAAEYRGAATVVYGHTPVPEPEWLNRTINIAPAVFSVARVPYPENELVSVPALHTIPNQHTIPEQGQQCPDLQQSHDASSILRCERQASCRLACSRTLPSARKMRPRVSRRPFRR